MVEKLGCLQIPGTEARWPVSVQMRLQRGLGPFHGGFMEEGGNGQRTRGLQ